MSWYATKSAGRGQGLVIDEATGRNVAVTYDEKDAPIIARAVNCHDKLVAALELFMEQYHIPGDRDRANRPEIKAAIEALAEARG
jgi:hypothetical protein